MWRWQFVDGELDDATAAAVAAHVAACRSCRDQLTAQRALLARIARLGDAETAPDGLRDRIAHLLRERGVLQ